MKTLNTIAAIAILAASASSFAADSAATVERAGNTAATVAAKTETQSPVASKRAQGAELIRTHKSTLATQLEQYK